jgi:hypothetical protein
LLSEPPIGIIFKNKIFTFSPPDIVHPGYFDELCKFHLSQKHLKAEEMSAAHVGRVLPGQVTGLLRIM